MQDFNRHTFPNAGWAFRQPQTNWVNPFAMVGFDASVKAIRQHRLANPAITAKHGLATDPVAIANELETYTRRRLGIPDPEPSFFWSRRSNSQNEAGVAAGVSLTRRIAQVGTGIATLADWIGEGGSPVDAALAENRAAICVQCPKNMAGDLFSLFTRPVANLLQKQLEERKQLNLSTSHDAALNICDACGCPLKLKVHVPLRFIKEHIKDPERSKHDEQCWILKEA